MYEHVRLSVLLAVLGLLAACSEPDTATPGGEPADASAASAKADTASVNRAHSGSSAELVPIRFSDWEKAREELVPNIVVVDLWATWCTPCLERFPHMVEMHHKYKGKGVTFVSLSLDDREDQASIDFARAFLKKQNAEFDNYLLDENIIDGMNMVDIQTIPAVNIYDRTGYLTFELNNNDPNRQFSDQDIDYAIQDLLASD